MAPVTVGFMTYDAQTRDAYRRALAGLTALSTIGALTACGWLAGVAARDHASQQQAKDSVRLAAQQQARAEWQRSQDAWLAAQPKEQRVRTVWKKRREVTLVETRLVRAAAVGTGGTLTSGSTSGSGTTSGTTSGTVSSGSAGGPVRTSGGTNSGSVSHSAPAPAPPKPPPAPAPSSGS